MRLSEAAKARRPALLRSLAPLLQEEGMIWLAGGLPSPSAFPIESFHLQLKHGVDVSVTDPAKIAKSQQYMLDSGGWGYVPLLDWLRAHVAEQHAPPYDEWGTLVSAGNADAMQRVWETLLNPGDTLLIEELSFAFSISILRPWTHAHGLHVECVPLTPKGIDADALDALLTNWATARPGARFPRVLFLVPQCQNPSGTDIAEADLRRIYAVAQRHDLSIVEDDPYRYLHFGDATAAAPKGAPPPGLRGLRRSFLSVDTDGRVLRLDSMSKWIAPGLRMGFISGPKPVLTKLAQGAPPGMNVASFMHVLVHSMLSAWGAAGVERHLGELQLAYRHRCAVALAAMDEHLSGLAEWRPPTTGMFVWVRLPVESSRDLMDELRRAKVAVVPGAFFTADADAAKSPYVRLSFAYATDDDIREGIRRLGELLRAGQSWGEYLGLV